MGGPPNCPSDLCVCKDKGDTSKKWPPAKKVKPYDPSTVPTYRPLKGQGNDHQPPVKEGDEKPPAWKPGQGEQAIFPGGDPKSCTAVEGQTQSNDVWCVNNCDIANWKNQAPECPRHLCQCTRPGDKKKKWEFAPVKDAVDKEEVPTWDPSTVPQWTPPEETAADRRGDPNPDPNPDPHPHPHPNPHPHPHLNPSPNPSPSPHPAGGA